MKTQTLDELKLTLHYLNRCTPIHVNLHSGVFVCKDTKYLTCKGELLEWDTIKGQHRSSANAVAACLFKSTAAAERALARAIKKTEDLIAAASVPVEAGACAQADQKPLKDGEYNGQTVTFVYSGRGRRLLTVDQTTDSYIQGQDHDKLGVRRFNLCKIIGPITVVGSETKAIGQKCRVVGLHENNTLLVRVADANKFTLGQESVIN